MSEITGGVIGFLNYLHNIFTQSKPSIIASWASVVSAVSYIIFPNEAYIPAAMAVLGAMVLDIITKYYALKKPHGTVINAIRNCAISSNKLWEGTKKKIIGFSVVMILCGLSARVVPIGGVAVFLTTVVYSVMFLRECQSCIENLMQAGHDDLGWLVHVIEKRKDRILDMPNTEEELISSKIRDNKPLKTQNTREDEDDGNRPTI